LAELHSSNPCDDSNSHDRFAALLQKVQLQNPSKQRHATVPVCNDAKGMQKECKNNEQNNEQKTKKSVHKVKQFENNRHAV
jgi:hypothetical protein